MHRKYGWIIVVIVVCASVSSTLTGCSRIAFRDSKEKLFLNDYDLLTLVADYLANLEHERVYISSTFADGEISVYGETHYIDNEDVVNTITMLKESGCTVIQKIDGIITFQYWATLDEGGGFAYSPYVSEPHWQFQTYLEKLSTENWFYYEEN